MLPAKMWAQLPKLQEMVDKDPDIFFSADHPVYGLEDIAFITTRQALDKLVSVNLACQANTEPAVSATFDRKPEQ